MKSWSVVAMLALVACGGPAPQDMVAYYAKPDGIAFTVEAAASGDARVTAGDQVMIRSGGQEYLVRQDAKGSYAARTTDYVAILDEGLVQREARPQPDYVSSAGNRHRVAGHSGRVWKIHPREVPSLPAIEAVVSDDPALAGIGRGVAMHVRLLIDRNARGMGAPPGKLEAEMKALFDKGTVLRFGPALELERIERKPVLAERFLLPPVLNKDALRARLSGVER